MVAPLPIELTTKLPPVLFLPSATVANLLHPAITEESNNGVGPTKKGCSAPQDSGSAGVPGSGGRQAGRTGGGAGARPAKQPEQGRMGEAPRPPGAPILLLLLSLARSGAACDGEKFNFQQDLPPEEQYRCLGAPWLIPSQVSPSIAKTYQAEESKILCMGTKIVYNQSIPNSGPHRLFRAVYGEYEYCPPQRWLHNLKHGGIAFLYHPCVHPLLRDQLVLLARSCLPDHILTPHTGLTQKWPLALVAWGATLQMARVELDQAVAWLRRHAARGRPDRPQKGKSYRHLLKHQTAPALLRDVCPEHRVQVLQKLFQGWKSNKIPSKLQAPGRHQRALGGPVRLPPARAAEPSNNLMEARIETLRPITHSAQAKGKDIPQPAGGPHQNTTALAGQGSRPLPSALPTKVCWCLDGELDTAQQQQQRKKAKGQQAGVRVPTPRTEEAAWAASALTFLLVVLTVAVLYTRLHRNCRRGLSLYWTTSSEDGQETVAAVIKRRLLSTQSRRKKRSRKQLKALLPTTSSDSSE
ncbi:tumor protein p53-inducible protein 13 [Tiliqua scincoides]|uniref:tumor protein p53-inducible protein 13 n=1 Tax=Tiliqua scincoides TaxID=71010 RepID=UPI0034635B87